MPFTKTALERLLTTERHRRQADQSSMTGFAVPALSERAVERNQEPLAVTDARGGLVSTKVSVERGVARCGFFECTTAEEGPLLGRFFSALWEMSVANGWGNRGTSLSEASNRMQLPIRSIVVPYGLVEKVSGLARDESDRLMGLQGYITKGEQQILVGDLPEGQVWVAAAPALCGFYTRVDDRLGIMLTRVDQTVFLIREGS